MLVYALGLLSIGITKDWRLTHEDNGALYTTLALSHLRLGVHETRFHDLFYNPHTGAKSVYGNHPPGLSLVLALAFWAWHSDAPWAARTVPIAFHLAAIAMMMALAREFFDEEHALLGGFLMATLAMGSVFGRMVNFEALCLFTILVQLWAYAAYRRRGHKKSILGVLVVGIVAGGLIDWPAFYFALAVFLVEFAAGLREKKFDWPLLGTMAIAATGTFIFDLWHLWYSGGTLQHLWNATGEEYLMSPAKMQPVKLILTNLEMARRYFSHMGVLSTLLVVFALVMRRSKLAAALLPSGESAVLGRLLAASGMAAGGYLLCFARHSGVHHYAEFYFYPLVVFSILLVWNHIKTWRSGTSLIRFLPVVFWLDILGTSYYTLYFRHTHPLGYAIETTQYFRRTYLAPTHFPSD